MKKITGQFTKYTVILLIVGAILVLIGGLSVARKAISNQREIALDMTAKTRVDVISKENTELKAENAQLKKQLEQFEAEKKVEEQKLQVALAIQLAQKSLNEENPGDAKLQLAKVDQAVLATLPEEYQTLYNDIAQKLNEQ